MLVPVQHWPKQYRRIQAEIDPRHLIRPSSLFVGWPSWKVVNQFRITFLRSFGINPFEGEHRMEETFNYIYSQAFADDAPEDCLDAYWSLLRMYAAAIARTTNNLSGTSRGGVGR